MSERRGLAVAAAALSLVLNLVGLMWGLPARWHPDEKADDAAAMVSERTLIPRSFINPSLPLYLMMPVVATQQRLAAWGLLPESLADPLLAGRVLSAAVGAAAVLALGLWGGGSGAPLAALLLALSPGFVNLCHFATPEAWLLLLTVGVLVGSRCHLEGKMGTVGLGLLVGLAGATKYTAAALLAPALLAVWFGPESERAPSRPRTAFVVALAAVVLGLWIAARTPLAGSLHLADARLLDVEAARRFVRGIGSAMALGGAALAIVSFLARDRAWARRIASTSTARTVVAAGVGFLIGTPAALVRPVAFLSDLAFNQQTRFEYKGLIGESSSFGAYVALLADGLTWPLLILALAGLAAAVWRGRRGDCLAWVWVAAAVAPYLLVASSGHRALRFAAPVFPPAALLAAAALPLLARERTRTVVLVAVLARLAAGAVLVDRLFLVDSRHVAARWLESNVPPGTTIDVITNHPGYAPAPAGRLLRVVPTLSREMAPVERFEAAARDYSQHAAAWLVLTESYYQRFLEHPLQHPARARFFTELLEGRGGFEIVARFRQHGWRRPPVEFVDPEVVVLRRTTASRPEPAGTAPRPAPPESRR